MTATSGIEQMQKMQNYTPIPQKEGTAMSWSKRVEDRV